MILWVRPLHFLKRIIIENDVFVSLKMSWKKIRLQDAFHPAVDHIFKMKTSWLCTGMFLRVLSLFRAIPKSYTFFKYLMWIKIFTTALQCKFLNLKAISVSEVDICLNRTIVLDIWSLIPGLNKINFCED